MICRNCGNEIDDLAVVCPYCGAAAKPMVQITPDSSADAEEKANVGLVIVAVLVPLVGVILGIVELNKGKKRAGKTYLWAALISWAVRFLLGCCIGILGGVLSAGSSYETSYYAMVPFFLM